MSVNKTKKQQNRKSVAQNKRNRMINRRYSSTIKSLFKLFLVKTSQFHNVETLDKALEKEQKKSISTTLIHLINNLYSSIDKAIKKNVIHKNNGARKKSRISKILNVGVLMKELKKI